MLVAMEISFVSVIALLLSVITGTHSQSDVTVTTSKGQVVGTIVTASPPNSVAAYNAFLGIPYGQKPTRFQPAVAPSAWSTALQAKADGPACPQPLLDTFSEDCLYLNVFTPLGASTGTKYPVIVFIHGSAFIASSSSSKIYGPDFLIPQGVILVTFNYRLGAPGFLSLGSKTAPGNMGLFDSLLALKWIQTEIGAFGGLPSSVTLMGQSAGAVMTMYHYLSPLSTGLFQRAIAQSGSPLATWGRVTPQQASTRARQLAKLVKCDSSKDDATLLACLQQVDIKYLIANETLITLPKEDLAVGNLPWVPVLDSKSMTDNPFFGDTLENLMYAAAANKKPLLTGFNAQDGALLLTKAGIYATYPNAEGNLIAFLTDKTRNNLNAQKINSTYFKPDLLQNKVANYISLYTDYDFAYPSVQVSKYFANITFGYLFSYEGAWGDKGSILAQFQMRGVSHGAEIPYLFYSSALPQPQDTCSANADDLSMKTTMVTWWTNFAKNGVPDSTWNTVDKAGYQVINSKSSMTSGQEFETKYFTFWASMTPTANSATTNTMSFFAVISLCTVYKLLV